jgi:8-oxo-dGTP pyrophosphatase MutT (NUDIX family)
LSESDGHAGEAGRRSRGKTQDPNAPVAAAAGALTHAGAVVWRQGPKGPLFLLVTARGRDDEWVLPKGHIDAGETAEQAARREVREETGLDVRVGEHLGTEAFTAKGENVICAYYLAETVGPSRQDEAQDDGIEAADSSTTRARTPEVVRGAPRGAESLPAPEGRRAAWLPLTEAIARSPFPATRRMLWKAAEASDP